MLLEEGSVVTNADTLFDPRTPLEVKHVMRPMVVSLSDQIMDKVIVDDPVCVFYTETGARQAAKSVCVIEGDVGNCYVAPVTITFDQGYTKIDPEELLAEDEGDEFDDDEPLEEEDFEDEEED